jgi:hypothetical protein
MENFPLPMPNKENLLGSGLFGVVEESLIDTNYVVKTYNGPSDPEQAEEKYNKYKKQYLLLKSNFGNQIPDAVFTSSNDPGNYEYKSIKIVQDRVFQDGDVKKEDSDLLKFIEKCIDIYISTYDSETQTGEAVDVTTDNLVRGHTSIDPSSKLYFIDSGHPVFNVALPNYIRRLESVIDSFHVDSQVIQRLKDFRDSRHCNTSSPQ